MFSRTEKKQNQDKIYINNKGNKRLSNLRERDFSQISSYQFGKTTQNFNRYNLSNNANTDKSVFLQDVKNSKGKTISNQSTQYEIFKEELGKNQQTLRNQHNGLEIEKEKQTHKHIRYRCHNRKEINENSSKKHNPEGIFPSLKIQETYNKTSYKNNDKTLKSPVYKKQKQQYWSNRHKVDPEEDLTKVQYFTYSQQGQTLHYNVQNKHNQIVNKQNQDLAFFHNIVLKPAYNVRKMHLHFMGLMDGHGKQGLKVVNFLQKQIIQYLQFAYSPNNIHHTLTHLQNRQLIQKVILQANQQLIYDTSIDTNFSGATLNFVCIFNGELNCFNVGDSRTYLISRKQKDNWTWKQMSNLHDLENQTERNRIFQYGGIIKKISNKDGKQIGPQRIWLKTQDNKLLYPGLTMTRSLGDKIGSKIGVIPTPQVTHKKIEKSDKYILMGSDGLFKYFTDNQIIKMLIPYITQKKIQQGLQKIISIIKRLSNRVSITYDDITINVIRIIHQGGIAKQKQKY